MYSKNLAHQLFSGCERPRRIYNRYLGRLVDVPCGKCRCCMLRKSDLSTLLCNIEKEQTTASFFCTLTYANFYVPRMRVEPVFRDVDGKPTLSPFTYKFIAEVPGCQEDGEVVAVDKCDSNYLNKLLKKTKLNGRLSYLRYRDLRNFLKRLRKRLWKKYHARFRYFAIGEYGPKTFRCHWHLLFFISRPEAKARFGSLVRKSWRYGRVDISYIHGGAPSYVAGYVNSFIGTPRVLQYRGIRPKVFHSDNFGLSVFSKDTEKIFENPVEYFTEKSIRINNKYVRTYMFTSLENKVFLKPPSFSTLTFGALQYFYTLYARVSESTGQTSLRNNLRLIRHYLNNGDVPESVKIPAQFRLAADFLYELSKHSCTKRIPVLAGSQMDYDRSYLTYFVYISMRFSYLFYLRYRTNLYRIHQSINYYTYVKPQQQLRKFYQAQEEYGKLHSSDNPPDYSCFYSDLPDVQEAIYKEELARYYVRFNKAIKHRELYDANDYFNYNSF